MGNSFTSEDANLSVAWDKYPREHLDAYLVSDVEDPRINTQSILSRALIADSLWPNRFDDLVNAELRFGAVLTWILAQLKEKVNRYELLDAIADGGESGCAPFVGETFCWLQSDTCPIIDYISLALAAPDPDAPGQLLCSEALNVFSDSWRIALRECRADTLRVLEPACGSANDYRFVDRCGLSAFLAYTGVDVSSKNIANAKSRFPDIDFGHASILDSGFADASFDYVYVHDLFEHLSSDALARALEEVLRVARREVWLHFFNIDGQGDEHLIEPMDSYHWNTLSLSRICRSLEGLGADVKAISISELQAAKFGYAGYYNPGAYTILATNRVPIKGTSGPV